MTVIADNPSPGEKYEREALEGAFREMLRSEPGKRVLFWLLEQGSIYSDPFTGEDASTNYRLGRQATARRLIQQMNDIDPTLYPKLLLDMAEIRKADMAAINSMARNQGNEDDDF